MAKYYVANSGSSNNTGISSSAPWATISHINSLSFNEGDNIYFNKGDIWRETLVIPSSGTSGHPITFGAYGTGDRPFLYPTVVIGANWVHSSGSGDTEIWLYDAPEVVKTLWLDGDWVAWEGNGTNPSDGKWKRGVGDTSLVYYNPVGSTNPNTDLLGHLSRAIYANGYDCGIFVDAKSWLDIQDIQISHSGVHNVYLQACHDINLRRIKSTKNGNHPQGDGIHGVGNGFSYQYASYNILTEDCEASETWDDGFSIETQGQSIHDYTFRRCIAHNNGNNIGSSFNGFLFAGDVITVENCIAYGNLHDGFSTGATNTTMKHITSYSNYLAGVTIKHTANNSTLAYSILYDNNKTNNTGWSTGNLEIGWQYTGAVTMTGLNIYNNLFVYNSGTYGKGIRGWEDTTISSSNIKNNIFYGNPHMDLFVQGAIGAGTTFDHNMYSNANGSSGYLININGTTYTVAQLATWNALSYVGTDFSNNPLFVNPSGGYFSLKYNSSCINKGKSLTRNRYDYANKAIPRGLIPDIGAYEYQFYNKTAPIYIVANLARQKYAPAKSEWCML